MPCSLSVAQQMSLSLPETSDFIAVKLVGFGIDFQLIKSVPNREYQKGYERWVIPNNTKTIERLIEGYARQGVDICNRLNPGDLSQTSINSPSLADKQAHLLSKFSEGDRSLVKEVTDMMIQMRYSWNTVKSYIGPLVAFKNFTGGETLQHTDTQTVNRFLSELSARRVSESMVHRYVNAIKFYFEKVIFNPSIVINQVKRPKSSYRLPRILSKSEVARLINATENIKHKTIITTLYACGLRLSELLGIKLCDIRWDRNQVFIAGGKGKKDRIVMLAEALKEALQGYCDAYKPVVYLFEGTQSGRKYSASSVQKIVKRAAMRSQLSQRVTPHVLRHCFATHLHDGGISIKFIQELLGHADVKTTMVYTHVSTEVVTSISSPLDNLNFEKP